MKQKISKKILGLVLAISLLSAGCFGGGGGSSTPGRVTLKIWDPFEDSQNLQALISEYQQAHPNVQIVYTKKDITTYSQDLIQSLASGTGPDIYSINNSWLPTYVDKLVPVATTSKFTFKAYKDAFVDVAVNDFTIDQKIYAVPLYVDSLALYYNKDVLGTAGIAVPPKTWQELEQQVQKIKRADQTGYFTLSGVAAGTSLNINRAVDILYLMMLQKGTVPYSVSGGRPSFAQSVQKNGNYTTPGLEGLSFYTSFANPSSVNYNWNSRSDYSVDAFINGRAAFLYSYSYMADTIRNKNPNLNFDVAGVPQTNLNDPSVNFANYWGLGVSRQAKSPNTAWDFLEFLTSKESLDKYYAKNKKPSSRKDLISLQIQDPEIGVFANANLTAKSFYKPDQEKMDGIFAKLIDNVILKGVKPEDALRQAEQEAQTLVRDRR